MYLKLDDPQNRQMIASNIRKLLYLKKLNRFDYLLFGEHQLNLQLQELVKTLPVFWQTVDTKHLY